MVIPCLDGQSESRHNRAEGRDDERFVEARDQVGTGGEIVQSRGVIRAPESGHERIGHSEACRSIMA